MLTEVIRENLNEARKNKDKIAENTWGNVLAKIIVEEKTGKGQVTDETVASIIKKEIKELKETQSYYKDITSPGFIQISGQIDLLNKYLPNDYTDEQVIEMILEAAKTESNKGRLVGIICKKVGAYYDRGKVKPLIDKVLP